MLVFGRTVTGAMSPALFCLGIAAFVIGALHPVFAPIAIPAFVAGCVCAAVLSRIHASSRHPSIRDNVAPDESGKPLQPR
jgi:hypothetical protein